MSFDLYEAAVQKVVTGIFSVEEAVESIPPSLRTEHTEENIRDLAAARARGKIEGAVRQAEYYSGWLANWGERARNVGLSPRQLETVIQGGNRLKELGY
jgi:hypothetical protein